MEDLYELNRLDIIEKIKSVPIKAKCYLCSEFIKLLSTSYVRDIRLINSYSEDEVLTLAIFYKGQKRNMRFFTMEGIKRFVHEGKIYSYDFVCEYFKIKPKNKIHLQWIREIKKWHSDGLFETSRVLTWLYEKKRQTIKYDLTMDIEAVFDYTDTHNGYNTDKLEFLFENF